MRNRLLVTIAVFACVVFSFFFFPTSQNAQTLPITVRNASDTVVAGACVAGASTPDCSLRGAIQAANSNPSFSLITFGIPASDPFCSAGVCTILLMSALPAITEPVSIAGTGADKLIVKAASGSNIRIFNVSAAGTVSISDMTLRDVVLNGPGAGIFKSNFGTLNVTNTVFSNNVASSSGGGISCAQGECIVTNSTFANNHAGASGSSTGGGAIGVGTSVQLRVTNSTITGNTTQENGAGIFNRGTAIITNTTISGNVAFGAISGDTNAGGGIYNDSGITRVKNSLIALNTAPTGGPDVFGTFVSDGFNLIGKRNGSMGFENITDQTGTIALPLDPMLDPLGLRDNGGPMRTIALLIGSPAIDKASSTTIAGEILTTDQRGIYRRVFDNTAVNNASNGADIGAFELQSRSPADFDGDHKTDIGIFRPPVGEWWYQRSSDGQVPALQFGAGTDRIVPADFTGDGKADIAFWRPSTGVWFILRSENLSFFAFPFGTNGDIPAPADFDNDGKADATVFRPSTATWFIQRSSDNGTTIAQFGANGDVPVAADYDGDGLADIAIYRPSLGQWWMNRSTAGVVAVTFGASTDKPVQGDYTGDGKADVAFWRPSTGEWFILRSENASFFAFPFGISTDIPAPGDYDGDGRFDATVFRPSQATWYVQRSTAGTLIQQFGANGDRPIPNAFVP